MPDGTFDKLIGQDVRVLKASRMVPSDGPLAATTIADIRRALDAHMAAGNLSQADVADAIGQSTTYVNNLLKSAATLPATARDRMWRDLNNWLEREARAAESERPADFVRTRPAERLIAIAERLTERADMAVAFGPAGIGKSTAIEAIVAEIRTAVAVTAGYDTRTAAKFTGRVIKAVSGRSRKSRQSPSLDVVIECLRMPPKVRVRNLLIIDQAHLLPDSVWPILAELHDCAQCSVLLVGTIDLKRRAATDDDPDFGQISSRFGMRINLAPELVGRADGGRRGGREALHRGGHSQAVSPRQDQAAP